MYNFLSYMASGKYLLQVNICIIKGLNKMSTWLLIRRNMI